MQESFSVLTFFIQYLTPLLSLNTLCIYRFSHNNLSHCCHWVHLHVVYLQVFLQHLTPLLSLSTFTALWLTILEFMDKYMHADNSDLLVGVKYMHIIRSPLKDKFKRLCDEIVYENKFITGRLFNSVSK